MFDIQTRTFGLAVVSASFSLLSVSMAAASPDACPDLSQIHDIMQQIDDQIAGTDILAYANGPLKPGKIGYGFALREPLFSSLSCKANTLFHQQKAVLNCSVETTSQAESDNHYNEVLDCFIESVWGQNGIYLIDPNNSLTQAKLYAFENSFSIEFVQDKGTQSSETEAIP